MKIALNDYFKKNFFPIKYWTLIIFFLFFPFIKPDSFRRISILDTFFDLWCLLDSTIIFVIAFRLLVKKKWKPSLGFWAIIVLNIWILITTFINSGFQIIPAKSFVSITALSLLIDTMIKKTNHLINGMMISFELIIYSNFLTYVLFPHGMYADGLYTTNWLMGYDNSQIKFFLCGAIVAFMYGRINNSKSRSNCLIAIIVASVLFTKVFTALMGLIIIVLMMTVYHLKLFKKLMNPKFFLIIALLVFSSVVLNNSLIDKMELITRYTGKGATLTTRFDIWKITLKMFTKSPLYGYGWNPTTVRTKQYMNPFATHAHDTYLEYIYQGGIIGLILFLFIIMLVSNSISKCKNKKIKCFASSVILAFLFMMLFESYLFPIVYALYLLLYHCNEYKEVSIKTQLMSLFGGEK